MSTSVSLRPETGIGGIISSPPPTSNGRLRRGSAYARISCGAATLSNYHSRQPVPPALSPNSPPASIHSPSISPDVGPQTSSAGSAQPSTLPTCPHCLRTFTRPAKLQDHILTHSDSRPYICDHEGCLAAYRTKDKLLMHEKRSHLSPEEQEQHKKFVCRHAQCGRRFWTNQHLQRHADGVHDVGATDLECDIRYQEARGLVARYECSELGCTQVFSKRKRLRRHIWEAHTDHQGTLQSEDNVEQGSDPPSVIRNKLPFICQYSGCLKRFATNSKRKSHFKTHDQQDRYTCALVHPDCSPSSGGLLTFPTWSALQSHMRLAHPPACHYPTCNGKIFRNRENLKMHLRRHEEREYHQREEARAAEGGRPDGEWCEASSEDESDGGEEGTSAPRPQRSVSLRTFQCSWRPEAVASTTATSAPDGGAVSCSKSFKSSHALQTHVRVAHLNQRPFGCVCGKSYGHKHLLKRHLVKCTAISAVRDDAQRKEHRSDKDDGDRQSELDEEEEDDVFRLGGGALPEELREGQSNPAGTTASSRGSATSRRAKRKHRDDRIRDAEAYVEDGASMIDLLTGRGYASSISQLRNQDGSVALAVPMRSFSPATLSSSPPSRTKRPRVLPCPWSRLPDWQKSTDAMSESRCPNRTSGSECAFHFSRLYDVARHLKGEHGVPLSQGEVRGLFTEEEVRGLPKPRGVSRGLSSRCGGGQEGVS